MKYKIIFDTTGLLSNNQIAQILNCIQPMEVFDHQQANKRLLLYASFDKSLDINVEYINEKISDLDYAHCSDVIKI